MYDNGRCLDDGRIQTAADISSKCPRSGFALLCHDSSVSDSDSALCRQHPEAASSQIVYHPRGSGAFGFRCLFYSDIFRHCRLYGNASNRTNHPLFDTCRCIYPFVYLYAQQPPQIRPASSSGAVGSHHMYLYRSDFCLFCYQHIRIVHRHWHDHPAFCQYHPNSQKPSGYGIAPSEN